MEFPVMGRKTFAVLLAAPLLVGVAASAHASVTVASPVTGSTYATGQDMKIIWSQLPGDPGGPMQIQLMEGSPEAPLPFTAPVVPDIDTAAGSFTWTVPANVPPASDYFLQFANVPAGEYNYSGTFSITAATTSGASANAPAATRL
jgi:Ser-Thr-rich glycosyl-phosphatidyl-inositol-anchored membrane family